MSEDAKLGFKIFLQCGAFIAALAGFNLYAFYRGGSKMFLAVGVFGIVVLIGWIVYYTVYVRRRET